MISGLDEIAHTHGNKFAQKVRQLAGQLYDVMAGAAVHELRGILTPLKETARKLRDEMGRPLPDQTTVGRNWTRSPTGWTFSNVSSTTCGRILNLYQSTAPQHSSKRW